jgi:hypothetical protein
MSIDDAKRDAARAAQAQARHPEMQLEAAEAVSTDVLRDIVADSRRSSIPTTSAELVRGSGSIEPTLLKAARWRAMLRPVDGRAGPLGQARSGARRNGAPAHTCGNLTPTWNRQRMPRGLPLSGQQEREATRLRLADKLREALRTLGSHLLSVTIPVAPAQAP